MASLIQVRDLLALQGRMEAKQLSLSLHTPQPMIDAMLESLEAMGKAVRIQEEPDGCLSGSCKSCPEGKAICVFMAIWMDWFRARWFRCWMRCGRRVNQWWLPKRHMRRSSLILLSFPSR